MKTSFFSMFAVLFVAGLCQAQVPDIFLGKELKLKVDRRVDLPLHIENDAKTSFLCNLFVRDIGSKDKLTIRPEQVWSGKAPLKKGEHGDDIYFRFSDSNHSKIVLACNFATHSTADIHLSDKNQIKDMTARCKNRGGQFIKLPKDSRDITTVEDIYRCKPDLSLSRFQDLLAEKGVVLSLPSSDKGSAAPKPKTFQTPSSSDPGAR